MVALDEIVCCPRCLCALTFSDREVICSSPECPYSREGFPTVGEQPVLIDFERSIFARSAYGEGRGAVVRREPAAGLRGRLSRLMIAGNLAAPVKSREMLGRVKASTASPTILVIGGGGIGSGAEALYDDPAVQVIGTDIYASENTRVLADGHQLPFRSETFDGVWIQAVLEHVLEPQRVVDEIHRVLKTSGLVYADTPFMQQVHEGAYDFTRFTQNGHRWLFRRFEQIDAGVSMGAGVATMWSILHLARALGANRTVAALIALPFFWLKYLDRLTRERGGSDAASGTFFFGVKSTRTLSPKELVAYYDARR